MAMKTMPPAAQRSQAVEDFPDSKMPIYEGDPQMNSNMQELSPLMLLMRQQLLEKLGGRKV